jgi:transcriptional regulator with XRE-family HTH domain
MAKRPKQLTPLRQVRQCSGLSQKEFASLVGINPHLYHSLELGRVSLTDENADRIFDHTGAAPTRLDHRRSAIALAADGHPYSQKAWESWRKYLGKEYLHWQQTNHLLDWTHFVCDIARKQGRLRLAQRALARALKTLAIDCGLEPAIKEELAKIKMRTNLPYTYGVLRNSELLAKAVGFKDITHKGGDEIWEGTVTSSVSWNPFGWCPPQVTQRLKPLLQLRTRPSTARKSLKIARHLI